MIKVRGPLSSSYPLVAVGDGLGEPADLDVPKIHVVRLFI